MAKPKPNLAAAFDNIPPAPEPSTSGYAARPRRNVEPAAPASTVLVGANLPPTYARNLALLHAETGRSKKQLLQEALDMLFTAKAGAGMKNITL